MKIKNLKITKAAAILLTGTIALSTLSGCSKELAPSENYDTLVQQDDSNSFNGNLTQEIQIPGEEFTLIAEYSCDESSKREWRITSDKFLYLKINTKNLPDNIQVYIDNVHIDTSIKSKYASVDGIKQDSMDDRIHNSKMIGFPIGNDVYYYGINAIEGCNETFIQGTLYGYNGYNNGNITQRRFTEADYQKLGVYANKIQIVYDLLVKNEYDKDFRNISVKSDFLVKTTNTEIQYENEEEEKKLVK